MGMEFAIIYKVVRKHILEVTLEQSPKGSEGWSPVAIWGIAFQVGGEARRDPVAGAPSGLEEPHGGQRLEQGQGRAEWQERRSDSWHRARSCRAL